MARNFLFYDLETFGLDSRSDRIAQVAMVRTDMKLRVIEDPKVLMCRIAPDYLPSPSACMVTGITPQQTLKEGIGEFDFIRTIDEEFRRPDTIVTGFNNIAFDDEFIRNTLYRNLMDPYEREWMNGCSRWDILDLVRAVHDFRPDGIRFLHRKENGSPSFKLVHLTEDNEIPQEGAHDALVDVYATINVAKLVMDRQPQLFEFYLNNRSKSRINAMLDTLSMRPVMYTCQSFTSERGASRPICPITFDKSRSSSVVCFDLTQDARTILDPDDYHGIVRVTTNRCPYIAPITILTNVRQVQQRLGIDMDLMQRNLEFLRTHRQEVVAALDGKLSADRPDDPNADPDLRIYMDGFYSDSDRMNMKLVNSYPPARKLKHNWHFDSHKIDKLLFRQVARNWPEVLDENERIMWRSYCATRLLQPFTRNPDYNTYKKEIDELMNSMGVGARDKLTLVALREYGQKLYDEVMH